MGTRRGYWFQHVDDDEPYKKLPDAERIARLRDSGFDGDAELPERDALSAEEVEALKPVVDFQLHTVSHPILTLCPPEKAAYETAESKHELERRFDLDIYAFDFTFTADVSDQIGQLTALVQSFNLKQGITNSLDVKLQNVQAALAATKAGDTITACNLMGAFINEVQAQSGKAITVQQAAQLIQAANDIRASLGCL